LIASAQARVFELIPAHRPIVALAQLLLPEEPALALVVTLVRVLGFAASLLVV